MKRFYVPAIIALTLLSNSAFPNPVDLSVAIKAARNFLYISHIESGQPLSLQSIVLGDPYTFEVDGMPVFYAFQTNPGFIIVSAEDGYSPVIGYSYEGEFSFDDAPAHYKGFILNYADQIGFIREHELVASPEIQSAWNDLLNADLSNITTGRDGRDVTPLLSNNWDQGSPYNLFCPEDPAGPGGHTWVGCVATAMAQIMYYWRYPLTGTGDHCYIPGNMSYGLQCADFGATTYAWDGMINGIDNKNPEPNAELQYHCAVSVNMNFSPDGSGSYSSLVPERLDSYFRYNDAQYLEKSNYILTTWISMLKAEIDVGHPLYYSGFNPTQGGHAFVCDGYQGDNFHFNFGWSGSGNGYYSLYDVGGFYQGQAIVRYFVPSDIDYPYHQTGQVTITQKSGSISDGSGPIEDYTDNTQASWLIDPQSEQDSISSITLTISKFDLAEGDSLKVFAGGNSEAPLLGAFSGTNIPSQLVTNGNKMFVTFTTNGTGTSYGWYAEFSTTSPTWCSGLTQFTDPSGSFDDGSGSFLYQGGATCMWRINPPYANKITLTFTTFDTEEGLDKVKVYDGSTQIGEFSGQELPEALEATSGSMFITWSTSLSNNFQGWEAEYEVDNVGMGDETASHGISIFPNPANDHLSVRLDHPGDDQFRLELITPSGQVVYYDRIESGNDSKIIDIRQLPAGFYLLRVSGIFGSWHKKVLVL